MGANKELRETQKSSTEALKSLENKRKIKNLNFTKPTNIQRTSLCESQRPSEHISNMWRTPTGNTSNAYQASIEHVLEATEHLWEKLLGSIECLAKSNEHLSNIYRTSMVGVSNADRTPIEKQR